MGQCRVLRQFMAAFFPVFDLVDAAARIFIQGYIEAFDEFRIAFLDEVRSIFGVVFAGLGDIVAEPAHQFQTDHVPVASGLLIQVVFFFHAFPPFAWAGFAVRHPFHPLIKGADIKLSFIEQQCPAFDLRIKVFSVAGAFQQPCLVIDTGNFPLNGLVISHAEFVEKGGGAYLNAVAKPYGLDFGEAQHRAGQHCHGVCVVQEPGIGADFFHVPGEVHHHRDGAESTEHSADAQGIGDRLFQTVFLGDLKVCDGAGIISADLNGIDHIVRALQGGFSVFHPEISLNMSLRSVAAVDGFEH